MLPAQLGKGLTRSCTNCTSLGWSMWLLHKNSLLQRLRSDLCQGQALMVVLSCLNVQKRLCSGDRAGMKLLPSKLKTKSSGTCGPQALGCCMPAMSTQQGQRGGCPQKPSLASCPWLLFQEDTLGGSSTKQSLENWPACILNRCELELLPGMHLGPTPPPCTSCVAVPQAANSFNQRIKTLRTQDSNPPGKVTDSPILQRGSLNIKNSIVVLATLI